MCLKSTRASKKAAVKKVIGNRTKTGRAMIMMSMAVGSAHRNPLTDAYLCNASELHYSDILMRQELYLVKPQKKN